MNSSNSKPKRAETRAFYTPTFLGLPEISRLIIYRHVFSHSRTSRPPEPTEESQLWAPLTNLQSEYPYDESPIWEPLTYLCIEHPYPKWANTGLLGTCKQVRCEAQSVFYQRNWFSHVQQPATTERGRYLQSVLNTWVRRSRLSGALRGLRVLQLDLAVQGAAQNMPLNYPGYFTQNSVVQLIFELNSERLWMTMKAWAPRNGESYVEPIWLTLKHCWKGFAQAAIQTLNDHGAQATRQWDGEVIARIAYKTMDLQHGQTFALSVAQIDLEAHFLALRREQPGREVKREMHVGRAPPPEWRVEAW